ncbi:hypothetical protein SKUN_00993 [Spiroplasma kunkelii CR2-3x]|uniref:Uncharacterized protein n=1 Tax=Spiroplasma kunkelii CR2-3x TaxID=273035 RepID=A0A0K2JH16_SPIKU|nr:hypothetical protein SKUN_00993 [Spiroplasma kunkelii CR2-3x]
MKMVLFDLKMLKKVEKLFFLVVFVLLLLVMLMVIKLWVKLVRVNVQCSYLISFAITG